MRFTLGIAAGLLILSGCGNDAAPATATSGSAPWHDGTTPASAAGKIGGRDTPCPLPVSVDIPDKWKPAGLSPGEASQSGLDLLCEVDAKPAGAIGFIRVWAGEATDTRKALESWVSAQGKGTEFEYRDTSVGQGSGVEVTWVSENTGRRRAFAMSTPLKTVLFTTGGIDEEEYQKMLPALLLAKQSLTPLER